MTNQFTAPRVVTQTVREPKLQAVIAAIGEEAFAEILASRRKHDAATSWRSLAKVIADKSDVVVSHTQVQAWHRRFVDKATPAAQPDERE